MKRLLILMFTLSAVSAAAQVPNAVYMFDRYQDGTAVIKHTGIQKGKFNYDLISGKIMFIDEDGKELVLANPSVISSIEFGGRVFMHVSGDIFYEKISLSGNKAYYVRWRSNKLTKGRDTGMGMSNTSSIGHMTGVYDTGGIGHDLLSGKEYKLKPANTYYLWLNGRYRQFSNAGQLGKLFKDNAADIAAFARMEEVDFGVPADVTKIMEFCAQFM